MIEIMNTNFLFDPIQRSKDVESLVMQGNARRYYRFRYAKFYGGIVTADAVGCNLLCAYCWNYAKNKNPEVKGEFYSPNQVSSKLIEISEKSNCINFRMSGCEPFLGRASKDHLFDVIRTVQTYCGGRFVVETNGIMIGANPDFLDDSPKNCRFRIALKSHDPQTFEKVTNAKSTGLELQLKAIQAIRDHGLPCRVATMTPFADIKHLKLHPAISTEKESLKKYGGTMARLKARGL